MKFTIYDWCYQCEKELSTLGIEHDDLIDGNIFEYAEKIFNLGLNVMVYQRPKEIVSKIKIESEIANIPILYVDNRRFQQR